ncbi:MAG: class I mannose-6-phosphate isomerase [Elusimicrobiota bacterium]|jgi:mannose-6-phosphate isomerase|nr:class I mannose-6-phosphate isomerase [Elusimicrobiota bacterium]
MKFYPLEFEPIAKQKIWGGNKLREEFNKDFSQDNIGESWELSGVEDNVSIIKNGELKGQDLISVLKIYGAEILGNKILSSYGALPLLFKFIDAADNLSIQVHPNDELAKIRHNSFGKTEMYFVASADKDSKLLSGFKEQISKEKYESLIKNGDIINVLASHEAKVGDAFFIPAGRVHALGAGLVVAEIQQSVDITYRIFDYKRKDIEGKERRLDTELALEAINFNLDKEYKTNYTLRENQAVEVVKCPFFNVNLISLKGAIKRNLKANDSFIVYMCLDGAGDLASESGKIAIRKGMTILVPADIADIELISRYAKLLEIYI